MNILKNLFLGQKKTVNISDIDLLLFTKSFLLANQGEAFES
jgi:hypothetical protein